MNLALVVLEIFCLQDFSMYLRRIIEAFLMGIHNIIFHEKIRSILYKFSEPSLQRRIFPKDVAIKMNLLLYRILMSRLLYKKSLVLFLFHHRTYVLDIC